MKTLFNLITLSVLVSLLGGCASLPDWAVSPGRVNHYELQKKVKEHEMFWQSLPNPNDYPREKLEIIGHGVGSYRHYPMRVNEKDFPEGNKATAKNIAYLMDTAFSSEHINAIELDALPPSTSHDLCKGERAEQKSCSFIMHDEPDWTLINKSSTPKSLKYMKNNSVSAALNHFVDRGYHKKGKLMYLELKCNTTKKKCADDAVRIFNDIKNIISNNKAEENKRNWLTITSFFPEALKIFQKEMKKIELDKKVDYALIAGYDKFYKKALAQAKGKVPKFDKTIQDFIVTTRWLNRVWFSTRGIDSAGAVFEGIDKKRGAYCKEHACKGLKYSVSSYDKDWDKFKKILKEDHPFTSNLVSIMIDVDD